MIHINGKKSFTKIIKYDFVKNMENLERYIFQFSYSIRYLGRHDNYMQYGKNKIEIE